jgi:ribosomal protein L37AE/L43A
MDGQDDLATQVKDDGDGQPSDISVYEEERRRDLMCQICGSDENTVEHKTHYRCDKCTRVWTKPSGFLDEIKSVVSRREEQYGPPAKDFSQVAGMLNSLLGHKLREGQHFNTDDVACVYIVTKLSRMQQAWKRDHWLDIAGYCDCAVRAHDDLETKAGKHPR